jgi:hypothetical protein
MVTDYGYQIVTEEQRETKPVKDPHFVTLVVSIMTSKNYDNFIVY